jgi:hypothetical protein
VRVVYDRMSMTPGTSAYARNRAERQGWLPPLAWDDEMIEDPDYVPAEQVLRDWELAAGMHREWIKNAQKKAARAARTAEERQRELERRAAWRQRQRGQQREEQAA